MLINCTFFSLFIFRVLLHWLWKLCMIQIIVPTLVPAVSIFQITTIIVISLSCEVDFITTSMLLKLYLFWHCLVNKELNLLPVHSFSLSPLYGNTWFPVFAFQSFTNHLWIMVKRLSSYQMMLYYAPIIIIITSIMNHG